MSNVVMKSVVTQEKVPVSSVPVGGAFTTELNGRQYIVVDPADPLLKGEKGNHYSVAGGKLHSHAPDEQVIVIKINGR